MYGSMAESPGVIKHRPMERRWTLGAAGGTNPGPGADPRPGHPRTEPARHRSLTDADDPTHEQTAQDERQGHDPPHAYGPPPPSEDDDQGPADDPDDRAEDREADGPEDDEEREARVAEDDRAEDREAHGPEDDGQAERNSGDLVRLGLGDGDDGAPDPPRGLRSVPRK